MGRRTAALVAACVACLFAVAGSAIAAPRALYVSADYPSAGLHTLTINPSTGQLTEVGSAVSAGPVPTVPTVTPNGSRLFVGDFYGDQIYGFPLDDSTGAPGTGIATSSGSGSNPNSVVASPDGSALFSANYGNDSLGTFALGAGGALSAAAGSPATTGIAPSSIAVSPQSNFAYSTHLIGDTLGGFTRGGATALAGLTGFPLGTDEKPVDQEFSADGKFLFVAAQTDQTITTYAVNQSSGALAAVGTSAAVGGTVNGLAASPNGKWLAAVSSSPDTVTTYAIDSSGGLTQIGSPVPDGGQAPNDVVITPDSRFAYAANYNSGDVSGFSLDQATGAASALSGSPFGSFGGPAFSLTVNPNQGPAAAFTLSGGPTVSFDAGAGSDPDGSIAQYAWNFGDGSSAVTSAPSTRHTYSPGRYTASLTVTDNEGCSTTQIGTGQTLSCNGSGAAQVARSFTVAAPVPQKSSIVIWRQTAAQVVKRHRRFHSVRVAFNINFNANTVVQFQRERVGRSANGRCVKKTRSNARRQRCTLVRNYGRASNLRGRAIRNSKTYSKFGGRRIQRGRYRVRLAANTADGLRSSAVVARFTVR